MNEMMDRLGVDAVAAARHQRGTAFAEARMACIVCRSAGECRRWLDSEPGAPEPSDFCANMAFFRACRRERAVS